MLNRFLTLSPDESSEISVQCLEFAIAAGAGHYNAERAVEEDRAVMDHAMGKRGEYFAAFWLNEELGLPLVSPDMEVFQDAVSGKSWAPDLIYSDLGIVFHVKTITRQSVRAVGYRSWTFQLGNKKRSGGEDPVINFPQDNEWVIFVYSDDLESPMGEICGILPAKGIKPRCTAPEKLELRGLKACISENSFLPLNPNESPFDEFLSFLVTNA